MPCHGWSIGLAAALSLALPLAPAYAVDDLPIVQPAGGGRSNSAGSGVELTIGEPFFGAPESGAMSSSRSRVFGGFWSRVDPVGPATVTDLTATAGPATGQLLLEWTAPGDDAFTGQALAYELRLATSDFRDAFGSGSVVPAPSPQPGGQRQALIVTGLLPGVTYFLAIKTSDESNTSAAAFTSTRALAPGETAAAPPPFAETTTPALENPPASAAPIPTFLAQESLAAFAAANLAAVEALPDPARAPNGMITLVRPLTLDPANALFDNTESSAGVVFVAAPGQALEQTHADDFARLPVDFVSAAQSFTSPGSGFTVGALGIFVGEMPSASMVPFTVSFVEDSAGLPSGRTIESKSFTRSVSTEGAVLQFDGFDAAFPASGKLWAVVSSTRPTSLPPVQVLGATFDAYRNGGALGMGPTGWVPLKSPLGQTIQDLSFLLLPRPRGRYEQTVSRGRFNQGLRVLHLRHFTPVGARLSATLESGQDGTLFPARQDFALQAGAEVQDSSFDVTLPSAPVYRLTLDFDAALSETGLVTPAVAAAFGFFQASGTVESTILVPYHDVRFGRFEVDASTNGQGLAFYIRSARTREELLAAPYAPIAPGDTIMEPGDGPRLIEWAAELATADRFATPVVRGVTVNLEVLPDRKPAQVSVSAPAVLEAGASGFATALVLDDQGLPMANQRVSFAVAAGSATLPEASAWTDAQGIARIAFRPLDKTQLLSLEARAGDVAGRRGVYSVGGGLGGLGGLPTSDNGRAPHSLNLGNLRNFVARGAPHWGAHAPPKDVVSFAWARREVASVGPKLYAPDFFKKLFKAIGGAFNAAANAVKQVAQKTAALAHKLVNKAIDLHKQALKAVKKVAESKLFQQFVMPVINAGLMAFHVPLQFDYGPNGWSTTIGFMGTGLTVGERGQLGVSAGLKQKVPGTPFEVGMGVGYDFKTGFNAGVGAGLAGSTPGKGLGVGIGYSEKVGTSVNAAASYDGLQAGVGAHGYTAGLNMNGVPGARKISGQLKEMGVRSSNAIQFGGDWNGKTKLDFKNDIGADWSKVQDLLAKTRVGAWGVEKFGSMLQPGHWGGWTLPKVPLRDVAKTLAGYKAPDVPRPELPAPQLWPDMPTMTGGGFENLLADVAANPTCGAAPSTGGGTPGFPISSPKQGVTSVTEQTPGFYQGLHGVEGMSAHPVNTRTGNLAYGVEDVYLAGSPLFIQMVRFYNSLQAESEVPGSFGFGWSFSYGLSVAESDGFAVVRLGDGSSRRYVANADGSYAPPPGTFSRLTKLASGWRLTHKLGSAYDFDVSGRLMSITDPNGNQVTLSYASGRLATVSAPGGRTLVFAYNAAGRVVSVTGPMGMLAYAYDAAGNLTQVTGPDYQAAYTYDAAHNLIAYADPRSQTGFPQGSYTYDEFHRVKTESDGLGRVIAAIAYSIAPDGAQSTAVMDALGRVTRDAYDAQGRWMTRADPAGTTTVLSWDPNLQLAQVSEPDGRTTSFTYDARGNELSQTAPGGLTTSRTFDPATNAMLTETSPSGAAVTRYGYDAKANLVSITDPDGDATRFAFDAKGRLVGATDARGQVTSFAYDAAGLETAVTDARGARNYAYDAQGR
ncbi:MAG: YD repeat-containing protein, partial [Elusimicrobia bacterium]